MLGMIYGAWIGIATGLLIGSLLFRATVKQRSFARLDISADFDDNIPEPNTGGHVSKKLTKILGFTDEWVTMPDYQRLVWFNQVIKILWPHIGKVVFKQALEQAKPALADVCKSVPMGILESVDLEVLDLGESPVRLGGMKVYDTREDNLILEAPVILGSGLLARVSAKLRIPGTGYAIHLPVEVSDIQMRAVVRITASPIVESLPCVGGVSITMLKAPHFDASFKMANSFDFMALPFIHEAIKYGTKRMMQMLLVYPNKMDFPVMENFGVVPPPLGMLEVKVCRASGLPNSDFLGKSDPYCELSVREGRVVRTRTVDNNLSPTWDQTFHMLVDDVDSQSLTLVVKDDDLGFEDDILGAIELPLDEAEFIRKPREWVPVSMQLLEADAAGIVSDAKAFVRAGPGAIKKLTPKIPGSKKKRAAKKAKKEAARQENGAFGSLFIECRYQPFVSPEKQEEVNKQLEAERQRNLAAGKLSRSPTRGVMDSRGVLTVNVIRAMGLEYKEANEVDPYVRLSLFDPTKGGTESFRTSTQMNDASPRWAEKFDFIDVPATSFLTATIYDRSSVMESRLSLTPWKSKPDKKLGYVRIPVEEVARNRTMKDEWPLLEADKGDIVLALDWTPIVLEEPDLDSDEEEYDWRADLGDSGGGDGGYDPSDPKAAGRTPTRAEQLASDSTHSSGRLPDAAISAANPAGRKVMGYVDNPDSTAQDLSEGTFVYGPPP